MFNSDPKLKEKNKHGHFLFPIQNYHCHVPNHFRLLPLHWHDEMEITLIQEGTALYHIDLQSYVVHPNDLLIIPPFCLHAIQQLEDYTMVSDTFVFHLDFLHLKSTDVCSIKYLKPLYEGHYHIPYIIPSTAASYPQFFSLFTQLQALYQTKKEGYELGIKALLFQLVSLLFLEQLVTQDKPLALTDAHSEKLRIVLSYIDEHLHTTLSPQTLADLCHFNVYYFMKFFKKYTGMTCIQYIHTKRLEYCAHALETTQLSIMDIALEAGFNHISYFNKLFKSRYGVTPKAYRYACHQL